MLHTLPNPGYTYPLPPGAQESDGSHGAKCESTRGKQKCPMTRPAELVRWDLFAYECVFIKAQKLAQR